MTQQPQSAYNLIKKLVYNLLEGSFLMHNEQLLLQQQQQQMSENLFAKYRENNLCTQSDLEWSTFSYGQLDCKRSTKNMARM
jgi:hypothetical protein